MSSLDTISIKVLGGIEPPSGNATALLHELSTLLTRLVHHGESASIDLRGLPLTTGDYEELRDSLGVGAVTVRIEAIGESRITETRYPGVWWVTHLNQAEEIVADLIEVCRVPQILAAPAEDLADGMVRLNQALADTDTAAGGDLLSGATR